MVTPAPNAQWAEGRRAGRRSGGRQLFSKAEKWDQPFMPLQPWAPGDAPRDPRVPLMDSGSWTPRPQVGPQVGPPASPVPVSLLFSPLEILSSAPALSAPSLCFCWPSGQVLHVPGRLPQTWDVASCVLGSVIEVTLTVRTSIAWPSLSTCPPGPPAPLGPASRPGLPCQLRSPDVGCEPRKSLLPSRSASTSPLHLLDSASAHVPWSRPRAQGAPLPSTGLDTWVRFDPPGRDLF